jgi:hypothetical protein
MTPGSVCKPVDLTLGYNFPVEAFKLECNVVTFSISEDSLAWGSGSG